ncbi:MAG: hypothetical protein O7D29_02925 [Gemmatimonadetes bacterium]|nr:hypothetical protein [Gemmatimonadota bacterium]
MTTRIFGRILLCAGIVALLALLLPSAAWAHRCGPQTLEVKKGATVDFGITGGDYIDYNITDKGDPLVAKIEPPIKDNEYDVWFKITGTGTGVTTFKIRWYGSPRQGSCPIKVTVSE